MPFLSSLTPVCTPPPLPPSRPRFMCHFAACCVTMAKLFDLSGALLFLSEKWADNRTYLSRVVRIKEITRLRDRAGNRIYRTCFWIASWSQEAAGIASGGMGAFSGHWKDIVQPDTVLTNPAYEHRLFIHFSTNMCWVTTEYPRRLIGNFYWKGGEGREQRYFWRWLLKMFYSKPFPLPQSNISWSLGLSDSTSYHLSSPSLLSRSSVFIVMVVLGAIPHSYPGYCTPSLPGHISSCIITRSPSLKPEQSFFFPFLKIYIFCPSQFSSVDR